jgi:hypothetical protein
VEHLEQTNWKDRFPAGFHNDYVEHHSKKVEYGVDKVDMEDMTTEQADQLPEYPLTVKLNEFSEGDSRARLVFNQAK